jgi:isoleucyl-tRNA synthetase
MAPFYPKPPSLQDAPGAEDRVRAYWERHRIFPRSVEERSPERTFVFYEGPPTANGRPGAHHVIARLCKDIVCRYKTMTGHRVVRKAGWDTHGLPVEIEVEKELGLSRKQDIESYGVERFNRVCRESVFRYKKEWEDFTRRMGYWLDLDHPYVTYENEYIESVWWLVRGMWDKDLLYRGHKVVPYCPRCGTTLSSHELGLGYRDVTETSVYVKFPLAEEENTYVLAWTTTPWTLPGNVALAVGDSISYVKVKQERDGRAEHYILARELLHVLEGPCEVVAELKAKDLAGRSYLPLFDFLDLGAATGRRAYYLTTADFVTTLEGTGVVHTAVMYGEDDYALGDAIGLPKIHTVDEQGRFTEDVEPFAGRFVKDVEKEIVEYLRDRGLLYRTEETTHSYPFCWRCDTPLLYYARSSWYVRTTAFKEKLLEVNRSVNWFPPEVGTGRYGDWLANNVDWALSRDRYWGTPLPIWICGECGASHCVGSVHELRERGVDVPEDLDLHKPAVDGVHLECESCGGRMTRVPEVIDVWFDSGAMPYAQYHYPFENRELFESQFPADFISEGIDQSRGWFYSLMAIATLTSSTSSYRNVLVTGLLQDREGQKMSKSRGNAVDPLEIFEGEGADALRWYLSQSSPPWQNTRFDRAGVAESVRKMMGTLVNVYGFFSLYANLDGYRPDSVQEVEGRDPDSSGPDATLLDRWLLESYRLLVVRFREAMESFELSRAARALQSFVVEDLSNWYVRLSRRRFWKEGRESEKRVAYQTLYRVLDGAVRVAAPFIPFLSERLFLALRGATPEEGGEGGESVHLNLVPGVGTGPEAEDLGRPADENLLRRMDDVRSLVGLGRALRNREGLRVRQPLLRFRIHHPDEAVGELVQNEELAGLIRSELNVRAVEWVDDVDAAVRRTARPRFDLMGPKHGKAMKQVADALGGLDTASVARLAEGAPVSVSAGGGTIEVLPEEVEIRVEGPGGWAAGTEGKYLGLLDLTVTPELEEEGAARELVNRIQNLRKALDLEVTDRIDVHYRAEGTRVARALRNHREHIMSEVLAVRLEPAERDPDWEKRADFDLGGEKVTVWLRKHEPVASRPD